MSIDISPADRHAVITPDDNTDLVENFRSIVVGGDGGDVSITDRNGVICIYLGFIGILPIMPRRVNASGTTATNIIGIY